MSVQQRPPFCFYPLWVQSTQAIVFYSRLRRRAIYVSFPLPNSHTASSSSEQFCKGRIMLLKFNSITLTFDRGCTPWVWGKVLWHCLVGIAPCAWSRASHPPPMKGFVRRLIRTWVTTANDSDFMRRRNVVRVGSRRGRCSTPPTVFIQIGHWLGGAHR